MKVVSNKITLDDLCRWAKVETIEDRFDKFEASGAYGFAYDQAIEEGKSEGEAEEAGMEAERAELDEAYSKYHDAVISTMEDCFNKHSLELKPALSRRQKRYAIKHPDRVQAYEFRVVPVGSWFDALSNVRQTLNGAGPFFFGTNREFCKSGPYTVRGAVLNHLHWIPEWFDVYEGSKCRSVIERKLR